MTGAKAASNTFVSLSCWALKHDFPSKARQCWLSRSHPGVEKAHSSETGRTLTPGMSRIPNKLFGELTCSSSFFSSRPSEDMILRGNVTSWNNVYIANSFSFWIVCVCVGEEGGWYSPAKIIWMNSYQTYYSEGVKPNYLRMVLVCFDTVSCPSENN